MRRQRIQAAWMVAALLFANAVDEACAAWPRHSHVNLQVSTATGSQADPSIVPDGAGGAIVVWEDARNPADYDIYAHHILASGGLDPAWPVGGRALCLAPSFQGTPQLVSDGSGGAIVAWEDLRGGDTDIYAQHVLASGATDPSWPANGRALCTAAFNQQEFTIASDGAGGAIVTWQDMRNGATFDIYAQRVLASGAVDPAWPVNGRALCTAALNQSAPFILSDGASGGIVAWEDGRSGTNYIYAQRVLASGAVDPGWPVDGRALAPAGFGQFVAVIGPDGADGAIVAWQDQRIGVANTDIYAQHILASGLVDPGWPVDGRAVCAASFHQTEPVIVSDGAGGAIVAWHDSRTGISDIYAQRVLISGVVDPAWPVDGRALCTAAGDQLNPDIASDGLGGALVAWQDTRSGANSDIYAQHVLISGAVDPSWPANGRAMSTAALDQIDPVVASDGAGGIIAAWWDLRTGTTDEVFAQRVERFGYLGSPEPEIASVLDVPNDQGGRVKLSWLASYLDTDPGPVVQQYWVFRSVPTGAWKALEGGRPMVRLKGSGAEPEPGSLLATSSAAGVEFWEYLTALQAFHFLSGYSYIAPTTADSTAASNPLTQFMVIALDGTGAQYWPSQPKGGYSVDDLGPVTPALFTGSFDGLSARLHWLPNPETDLAEYRLYRGATPGFVPGPGTLVSVQADTGYVDVVSQPYHYKLSAVDVHGNESPFAYIAMPGATGVGDQDPPRFLSLRVDGAVGRRPVFHFSVPRISDLTLALYDVWGRQVRIVWRGALAAGEHARTWDGMDARGRRTPSGVYFARLTDGHDALVGRFVRVE